MNVQMFMHTHTHTHSHKHTHTHTDTHTRTHAHTQRDTITGPHTYKYIHNLTKKIIQRKNWACTSHTVRSTLQHGLAVWGTDESASPRKAGWELGNSGSTRRPPQGTTLQPPPAGVTRRGYVWDNDDPMAMYAAIYIYTQTHTQTHPQSHTHTHTYFCWSIFLMVEHPFIS